MADPISIFGLLVTVGEILSALHSYGQSVSHAKQDIQNLTVELLVLQGLLQQIKKRDLTQSSIVSNDKNPQHILESTAKSLEVLVRKLQVPASGFKKFIAYAKWPLNKADVDEQLLRFERLKSLLILIFLTESSQNIQDAVKSLRSSMDRDLKDIKDALLKQRDLELIKWLAPTSPEERHERFSDLREPKTRRWFLDGDFNTWLSEPHQNMLCITGKSGTGKTTLFSFAVDALAEKCRTKPTWIYAYWYCSFTEEASQKSSNALGSFLSQFAARDPSFLDEARSVYENRPLGSYKRPMDLTELEDALCRHLNKFDRAFILVDAINESQEMENFMKSLFGLMHECSNLRLLVSCVGDVPPDSKRSCEAIIVQSKPKNNSGDISAMVENALANKPGLDVLSEKLKQEIREAFRQQADGSFRWAYLALENLARRNTPRQVKEALKSLPATLEDSYTKVLLRIPKEDRLLVRRALLWLTFARKPLTLAELNEAIVIEAGQKDIGEDRLTNKNLIPKACRGLIDYYAGFVTLAHSSVETFLTAPKIQTSAVAEFHIKLDEGDGILMRKCLQYLSMKPFASGYCQSDVELKKRFKRFPLLEYAAQSWALHASRCKLSKTDMDLIMGFLRTWHLPRGGNHSSYIHALVPKWAPGELESLSTTSSLYYAASYGLYQVVEVILKEEKSLDINAIGGRYGSTPFFVACYRRHFDVALLLCRAGVETTLVDKPTSITPEQLLLRYYKDNADAQKLLKEMRNRQKPGQRK